MLKIYREIKADFAPVDVKAAFALVYTAAALACIYYLGSAQKLIDLTAHTRYAAEVAAFFNNGRNNLPALAYWIFVLLIFYLVIPACYIKFVLKRDLADYGLNFHIERDFWQIYFYCAAVMIPLVYAVSLTDGFSSKYPFFKVFNGEPYLNSAFAGWELIYFTQFLGLEFFFRGFLVHSLKPSLKIYSIFVMTVPYCMIHFGKPMPESFAAIFAGIFLGWLSYKNGNIWLGLLLHCTVALTMDVLALHHNGLLF